MTILGYSNQRVLSYLIYVLILVIQIILLWQQILSYNQSFIFLFGAYGVYGIIDSMLKINVDSLVKRHKKLITLTLTPALLILTVLFLIYPIGDSSVSVITIAIADVLVFVFIDGIDWVARRKLKQTTIDVHKN